MLISHPYKDLYIFSEGSTVCLWICFWLLFTVNRDCCFYSEKTCPTSFLFLSPSGELALTNFDTQRLQEITNRGIRISSNQVTLPASDCQDVSRLLRQCIC